MLTLERQLIDLGLTSMQARVYVALLRLGKVGAADISKMSKVNRVTTYSTLDELEELGLVKGDDYDMVRIYVPTDLVNLETVFMHKAKKAIATYHAVQELIPDLKSAQHHTISAPQFKYFEGQTAARRYLNRIPESDQLLAAYLSHVDHYELIKALAKRAADQNVRPQVIIPNSISANLIVYLDHRVVPGKIAQMPATVLMFQSRLVYIMQDDGFYQLAAFEDERIARVSLSAFQLNWRILSGQHLIMAEG